MPEGIPKPSANQEQELGAICDACQTGLALYAASLMGHDKQKQSELTPIDWVGLELQYRLGIKPLRVIAKQFGCSHAAITKRAKRDGWLRDLKEKVHARADALVAKAVVSKRVSAETQARENLTVEASAQAEVLVRLGHREDIAALRAIIKGLMRELSVVIERPEHFGMIHDALHKAVGMEREAFGLDTAEGTEGRPMVHIRDFTGRGDPDAPARPNAAT
jgi:hypothetical protein